MLIFMSILNFETLFFYQTYLCYFALYLVRPFLVNISETIAGDRSNRSPFWWNVSFSINHQWAFRSIIDVAINLFTWENQYLLWITAVTLFTIPTTVGNMHARTSVLHSQAVAFPICNPVGIIATRQLDALTIPWAHYASNNCIYFQSHLLCW